MTIQQCQPFRAGLLTEEESQDANATLIPEDIVMRLNGGKHKGRSVELERGFIGLRCRGDAVVDLDILKISKVKNDALQCWSGGLSTEYLKVDHSLPFKYTRANHADVGQFFGKWLESDKQSGEKSFDGLYIGSADIKVTCHGKQDKKNGFMFTELNEYRNIVLFPGGINYDSNSALPYFIDMTNGQHVTIGSQDNPVDPEKVSNKGIRIGGQGGTKTGAPRCENIVIHAVKGLKISLGADAKKNTFIHWYEKEQSATKGANRMKMSPSGIKHLINSEGSIPHVYLCEAGIETCGVGHALNLSELRSGKIWLLDGSMIDLRDGDLTNSQIEDLLRDDLVSREDAVNKLVSVDLNQSQFDALVSFVFNVGSGAFKRSTLLKKLNNGDYNSVPSELAKWNIVTVPAKPKPIRRVSKGLVSRRDGEIELWLSEGGDFDIGSFIRDPKKQTKTQKPDFKFPVLNESEKARPHEELKGMVKSRSIWGAVTSFLGFGGLGGVGTILSDKVNETVTNAINDPVAAIQGAQAATVDVAKLLDGVEKLQSWFLYGGIALLIGILGILVVILARLDDRKKGYR